MFEGLKCKNFIQSRISDTKSSWEKKIKIKDHSKGSFFSPMDFKKIFN